ncbi:MAG: hypothetical protein ABF296_06205 [Oceanococcaceae bacterium]
MNTPRLTILVVVHNMSREAPRTLHTLTHAFQRFVNPDDYAVWVLESGSTRPLCEHDVTAFGPQFRYFRIQPEHPSPVEALNWALARVISPFVACAIDGARMASPGCLAGLLEVLQWDERALPFTLGFHLGHQPQNEAMVAGYDQHTEDTLLSSVPWQHDGYRLFDISVLAGSSNEGAFGRVAESNLFAVRTQTLQSLGGFDPRFTSRGGGYVNLDVFKRLVENPDIHPVCLLSEGTFHQFHGGVATNAGPSANPGPAFEEEYRRLRGHDYQRPTRPFAYWGRPLPCALRHHLTM